MTDSVPTNAAHGKDVEIATVKKLLLARFSVNQSEEISSACTSVVDRLDFASHHYRLLLKATATFQEHLDKYAAAELAPETADLAALEELLDSQYHVAMRRAKLHVLDLLQHLHAAGDTMGNFTYQLANASNAVVKPKRFYLHEVSEALAGSQDARFQAMAKELRSLQAHDNHVFLSDAVNQAKHETLFKPYSQGFGWQDLLGSQFEPSLVLDRVKVRRKEEVEMILKEARTAGRKIPCNLRVNHPKVQIVPFVRREIERTALHWNKLLVLALDLLSGPAASPSSAVSPHHAT